METTRLKEKTEIYDTTFITSVEADGTNKKWLEEQFMRKWDQEKCNRIFSNACQGMTKFVSPTSKEEKMTKVLCLGKVQSGKTAFFIGEIALAFDNGYSLAYVLGGTKNNLYSQNKDRIKEDFSNNKLVFIRGINHVEEPEIRRIISSGFKVILMVLKNKHNTSQVNLMELEKMTQALSDIPSIIIDDEGDEYSPGKKPGGKKPVIHNSIVESIKSIKRGTYLSVTATPQSNLLISTLDGLSPDSCVLVEPGMDYTGANVFHDTNDNPLVVPINDSKEFENSVPESFKEALRFFLLGCAVRVIRGNAEPFSMLVHPSARTDVHEIVTAKITTELSCIEKAIKNEKDLYYSEVIDSFKTVYNKMMANLSDQINFDFLIENIKKNIDRTGIFEINTKVLNDDDQNKDREDFYIYRIYVGGNMLERGITLNNLAVTYIYRIAKGKNPADSMFQRARWFGYKLDYIDLCRVYMTEDMRDMFVSLNNQESFLWNTVKEYIETGNPIQKMPRIFRLDNKRLILTRKSISKTINLSSIGEGYSYDKWITNTPESKENYNSIEEFLNTISVFPVEYRYGRNSEHVHLIYNDIPFTVLYNNLLSKIHFPDKNKHITYKTFADLKTAIDEGVIKDQITVVKMRNGENEMRSLAAGQERIKELPQSYDTGTKYTGDKAIGIEKLTLQIHYVYCDESRPRDLIPLFALNNPFNQVAINYVTGDNQYGSQ